MKVTNIYKNGRTAPPETIPAEHPSYRALAIALQRIRKERKTCEKTA